MANDVERYAALGAAHTDRSAFEEVLDAIPLRFDVIVFLWLRSIFARLGNCAWRATGKGGGETGSSKYIILRVRQESCEYTRPSGKQC